MTHLLEVMWNQPKSDSLWYCRPHPSIIPPHHSCILKISGSDYKENRNSPSIQRNFLSDSAIRASLKPMPTSPPRGMQRTEITAVFKKTPLTFTKSTCVLLGFLSQGSAGGDVRGRWKGPWGGRSCVCRFTRVQGDAPQFLFTTACLICCCTMSLCTPENPCSECRRRVNYICISWCWPDNPLIHTPQSSASSCVYPHESRTLNSHKAWLGGFHFVSHTVASLEAKRGRRRRKKKDVNKPTKTSLWSIHVMTKRVPKRFPV